jgi:hypothetical protein
METAIYIVIGNMGFFTLIGIPGIIWLVHDNKRREQESEGAASQ